MSSQATTNARCVCGWVNSGRQEARSKRQRGTRDPYQMRSPRWDAAASVLEMREENQGDADGDQQRAQQKNEADAEQEAPRPGVSGQPPSRGTRAAWIRGYAARRGKTRDTRASKI